MSVFARASHARPGRTRFEGPTWLALVVCYGVWGVVLWKAGWLGWLWVVPAAVMVAFHSSLQHEVLHGHPTRSALINEALVFPALGLFIPYRRFRDLHLRHHNDARLTDPYDDPESFYLPPDNWFRGGRVLQWLICVNATFAGRMTIGPALALFGFWRAELRLLRQGDARVAGAWLRHGLGLVPVLVAIQLSDIALWQYVLGVAYPAMSLIMVRSFIEHRAAERAQERTAIVESGLFWRLLFLNNNLHAVHHERPTEPWYSLPAIWQQERDAVLARNGGYILPGYGAVALRWLLRRREPVVHPFLHDNADPR